MESGPRVRVLVVANRTAAAERLLTVVESMGRSFAGGG